MKLTLCPLTSRGPRATAAFIALAMVALSTSGCETTHPCADTPRLDVHELPVAFAIEKRGSNIGVVLIAKTGAASFAPTSGARLEAVAAFQDTFDKAAGAPGVSVSYEAGDSNERHMCGTEVQKGKPEYAAAFRWHLRDANYDVQKMTTPPKVELVKDPPPAEEPNQPPNEAMESDPNASGKVQPLDFEGKAPADAPVSGTFHAAFGWTDRHGRNAIVMGIETSESGDAKTSEIIADFLVWEGDGWTRQRRFRERVEACRFDTELKAITGPWSVTDIDGDGLGEGTFAWRSGCRSDVSPVRHKVLVVRANGEGGVDKYVLRGDTTIDIGDGTLEGGGSKADAAFETAPKGVLEHATKVWKQTAVERFGK